MVWVEVSAPKCGNVADQPSHAPGSIDDQVHREGVARFRAVDVERAGHRVEVRHRHTCARQVRDAPHRAAEAVLGRTRSTVPGKTSNTGGTPPKV